MSDLSELDDSAFEFDLNQSQDDLDRYVEEEVAADPSFAEALTDIAWRQEILRLLADRRRGSELTQVDVAAAMGTTQSAVSDIECGAQDLYLSTLQRYARAVGAHLSLSVSIRGPIGVIRTTPTTAPCYALRWKRASSEQTSTEVVDASAQACA